MASEKVAPTAVLNDKHLSDSTTDGSPTSRGPADDEETASSDNGSDGSHVFSDPKIAEYWRSVYENAGYECRHRFDHTVTWTPEEEKKIRRKVSVAHIPGIVSTREHR